MTCDVTLVTSENLLAATVTESCFDYIPIPISIVRVWMETQRVNGCDGGLMMPNWTHLV